MNLMFAAPCVPVPGYFSVSQEPVRSIVNGPRFRILEQRMGLGIYTKAGLKRHGLLRRVPARDEVLGAVEAAVRAKVADELAARMLRFERHEHTLGVCLDLTAELLEFVWDPKGIIVASAKTSTTGPGHHAHVVDMVKHVGAAL